MRKLSETVIKFFGA